jgi:ABC-type dipeptide/oligopeptide/nickel transport system permease subunit
LAPVNSNSTLVSGVQFAAQPSPPKARHSPPGQPLLPVQWLMSLLPPMQVPPLSHCSPASTTPLQQLLAGTEIPPQAKPAVGVKLGVAVGIGVLVGTLVGVLVGVLGASVAVFVGVLAAGVDGVTGGQPDGAKLMMFEMMFVNSPALMVPLWFLSALMHPPDTAGHPAATPPQSRITAITLVNSPADAEPLPLQSPRQHVGNPKVEELQVWAMARPPKKVPATSTSTASRAQLAIILDIDSSLDASRG